MKTSFPIFVLCAFMVMIASRAEAQPGATASGVAPTLKCVHESTNGVENFRTFEFDVTAPGDYHARFWLQPAAYPDGCFTRYKVFVNNSIAGEIVPADGLWQSASISGSPTVALVEGLNTISVSTIAPEFPEVETVGLSVDAETAEFPTDAYDSFVQNALGNGTGITEYSTKGAGGYSLNMNDDDTFLDIPLKYSFYRTYTFTASQEISVSSTSQTPHIIDIFYYGKQGGMTPVIPVDPIIPMPPTNTDATIDNFIIDTTLIVPPPGIGNKDLIIYEAATPDEIQGLNWKAVSEPALNNANIHIASKSLTIPKTGLYMIKLRSASDRTLGVADVNVNNSYYFEDSPIYYAKVSYSIPSGNSHLVLTVKDGGDPMLFMEGNDAQRIVGYNDDAPADSATAYGLTAYDSFIFQNYHIRTTGMHVCNFSTLDPESTCNVIAGTPGNGIGNNTYALKGYSKGTAGLSETGTGGDTAIYPSPASVSQPVTVTGNRKIYRVRIYGLCGTMVADMPVNDYTMTINPSDSGITLGGIYIFAVETENGISTHKIPLF